MPSDEHIALIRKGAAAWNAWRAEQSEWPDLSRAGLRGLDLSGFNLSHADLQGADLRGTNFSQANLSGANLEGANLFKAVLDGADLTGGLPARSPIPELRPTDSYPELAVGIPRRRACLWRVYSRTAGSPRR